MKKQRPVFLNLFVLQFPPSAIASILHRISGVALILFIPLTVWFLDQSLQSPQTFAHLQQWMTSPFNKLLCILFLAAFMYHLLAGFRHLIMDMGYAEGLGTAHRTAMAVIGLALILTLALGIWIW